MICLVVAILALASGPLPAADQPATRPTTRAADDAPEAERARELFGRLVALGDAFDLALADLYADTASIRHQRVYPNGEVRVMEMSGRQVKPLIRAALPLAKVRSDRSTYSEVTFEAEGEGVRIRAERYSVLKDYTSPISWLVGPGPDGTWLILEEVSQSRP